MAGTYTQRNMASEPNAVRHLQEANFGLELNSGNKMRVDVGILPSHIGLESNVGSQNATLTRSLLAENTPYYACGLRWSGHLDSGIDWAVLVLNGWQRIQPLNKEEWPSFGFQLQYVLPKNGLLNYSTFLGRQGSSLVHYQNGYASWSLTNRLRCSVEANLGSGASSHWFAGASMVASYNVKEDWSIALRAEQCSDPGAWFFPMHNGKAIQPGGWSLNTDWRFADKITFRAEARRLWSASGHSIYQGESISSLWLWTAAGCISF
jgi:hypothetical protein